MILFLPLSCSAQKNTLSEISTSARSDKKGHVIRFHLRHKLTSFAFSQPAAHRLQLQMRGSDIDTTNIRIIDLSHIISSINYYSIKKGIGIDLFLKKSGFFKASAYPDRNTKDLLVGLSRTTEKKLAASIISNKPFPWANIPLAGKKVKKKTVRVDSSYLKIKNKIRFDTVVLDPGHGGHDTGAIGVHHTLEKNVVLAIAKKVGGYINKYLPGVKVVYTRRTDKFIPLKERGRIANRAEGDLFVSIHCNSFPRKPRVHGTETYFLGLERSKTALQVMKRENHVVDAGNKDPGKKLSQKELSIYELANSGYIANSERLAVRVQRQFKNRANRKSRGVKQARFVVLYHASMPAILVETGFITNPKEQRFLSSKYGQSIIASAIFRAIRNYKVQFDKSQHLGDLTN